MEIMKKYLNKNTLSYVLGLLISTLGIVFCVKANIGLSMIAATPYIYAKYFVKYFPWITQGKAEYLWNLVLIFIMALIIRKWKWKYLLSFVTAFFAGTLIDFWLFVFGATPYTNIVVQVIYFVLGTLITSFGIAFFFRTTLPIQAYELAVVEIADTYKLDVHNVKKYYDYATLILDVLLSLLLFKGFVGVGLGTVFITLINSKCIKMFSNLLDKLNY